MKKYTLLLLLLLSVCLSACEKQQENAPATSPANQAVTQAITQAAIDTSEETTVITNSTVRSYLDAMNLGETVIIDKDASFLDALEGLAFSYNGSEFEIYLFESSDAALLQDAKDGNITYTLKGLESLGEQSAKAQANGAYLLLYKNENETVIQAFCSVTME